MGAVVRWAELLKAGGSGSTLYESALQAVRPAKDSVAISAISWKLGHKRTAAVVRHAHALEQLLGEASALLNYPSQTVEGLERLVRHEFALRKVRGVTAAIAGSPVPTAQPRPRLFPTARTALLSGDSLNQGMRMAAASALSGWAAAALGLDHPLWASMGAVAALQGLNYSITVQRSIQRLVGNVIGALLALALLSMPLGFWPAVAI